MLGEGCWDMGYVRSWCGGMGLYGWHDCGFGLYIDEYGYARRYGRRGRPTQFGGGWHAVGVIPYVRDDMY
jgi:hypothetical protein